MSISRAVALISGASSGLGTRIAEHLAREGVDLAVGYRTGEDRAETVCSRLRSLGRKAIAVKVDQTDPVQIEKAVANVIQALGSLDILINNAAMANGGHDLPDGDLDAFTPEIWDEMMAVNVRGPYLFARAAAPHLRASVWGRIVNIGSTIGHGKWYAGKAFAPSKAAVSPLTRFLAAALAPDVTANCVAPGLMVETGLGGGGPKELVQGWKDCAATGKTTSLDDVARQVVTLCKSATTTGQVIVVDGGIHFH